MDIGLIVNPIAGLGGRLALKGTDGPLAAVALASGAAMSAPERVGRALAALTRDSAMLHLFVAGGAMGQDAAAAAMLPFEIVHETGERTDRNDTRKTAERLLSLKPELILFAGGDGTARDIMDVVRHDCPVLGIPAGVKMHSAVFARTPRHAGDLAAALIRQPPHSRTFTLGDVVDRNSEGEPQLYGTMRVPRDPRRMQPAKSSPGADARAQLESACRRLREEVQDDIIYLIGPGSSTLQLKQLLSPNGTLLGVDIYQRGRLILADADERAILAAIGNRAARIILGVIGGQGFLIGRGNQQISPDVIRRVGRENIVALASAEKIAALPDRSLYADTGDDLLDRQLGGYIPVQVSGRRRLMMPLNAHLGCGSSQAGKDDR